MTDDLCWLVFLIVGSLAWLTWVGCRYLHPPSHTAIITSRIQRLLKPRTPEDCPTCRQPQAVPTCVPPTSSLIIPWCERKSRRGAPKRIATQGFACPNRSCMYYRITDAHVHALVGDGVEGKIECIQTLRCQACTTTFSTRRDTPLYRLKTASHRVAEVLTALSEGLDVSAAVRVFGHGHATITTWLTRAGAHV
jgi:hypothetical protein